MPSGRPTKYKPEMCDLAYEILSEGGSIVKVAAMLEINKDTLYDWIKSNKIFSDTIKLGLVRSEAVWEENPPEMSDARYIFNLKNKFGWSDKQSDREKSYSEDFDREGIGKMMKSGEMTVETGIKLLDLLFKEDNVVDANVPIKVNLVVKEIGEDE